MNVSGNIHDGSASLTRPSHMKSEPTDVEHVARPAFSQRTAAPTDKLTFRSRAPFGKDGSTLGDAFYSVRITLRRVRREDPARPLFGGAALLLTDAVIRYAAAARLMASVVRTGGDCRPVGRVAAVRPGSRC